MVNLPFKKKKDDENKTKEKKEKVKVKSEKGILKKRKASTGKSKIAYMVLKKPRVTEKGKYFEEQRKYVFEVFKNTNKIDVKKSIEDVYNVKVEKVNIINIPRKKRRLGKTEGWKKGFKKAMITLKEGNKIEIAPR